MAGVVTLDKVLGATLAHTKRTDREIAKITGLSLRKTREALKQLLTDGMIIKHDIPITYTLSEKTVMQENTLLQKCFVRPLSRTAPSWLGALIDGTLFHETGRQVERQPSLGQIEDDWSDK
jgi:hypothetical protein